MTGRLPHRVSDALSTKTERSYVSPSPKNSLSFQELPHNQSNKPTKTHAETAPDSHPTMGFWPYPYKHTQTLLMCNGFETYPKRNSQNITHTFHGKT